MGGGGDGRERDSPPRRAEGGGRPAALRLPGRCSPASREAVAPAGAAPSPQPSAAGPGPLSLPFYPLVTSAGVASRPGCGGTGLGQEAAPSSRLRDPRLAAGNQGTAAEHTHPTHTPPPSPPLPPPAWLWFWGQRHGGCSPPLRGRKKRPCWGSPPHLFLLCTGTRTGFV